MAIGIWELIALLVMLAVMVLVVAGIVWLLVRIGKSARGTAVRPASERLAELESLRKAERISAVEYEKQRATIVSSI